MQELLATRIPDQTMRLIQRPGQDLEVHGLLQELLASSVLLMENWGALASQIREDLVACEDPDELLSRLVQHRLLTEYQSLQISAGRRSALILGNYRILDRLGAGGMGVLFKAEHLRLRRPVAIKLVAGSQQQDPEILQRFFIEMRTIAQLQHPNIVAALDAGETSGFLTPSQTQHYFVMEYIPRKDLEGLVEAEGPLAVEQSCDLIHQVASALGEANKHQLVHRDIKPSNILVTPEGQAKLLDFGLVRHFRHRLTEPGAVMGTAEYLAPEQVQDSSSVDIRADIYSLGGTLFWCLSGKTPFASQGNVALDLSRRLSQAPPSVRVWRPEIPAALDAVMARMMALDPDDRYATPEAVMRILLPFLKSESCEAIIRSSGQPGPRQGQEPTDDGAAIPRVHRVLIVDDHAGARHLCRRALEPEGIDCDGADNGLQALEAIAAKRYDLALVDIEMPVMTGPELLKHLRDTPPGPHLKIIMVSARASADEMAQLLSAGADDYLTKPLSFVQLRSRVKAALRLKVAQERSDLFNRKLLALNHELEQNLTARDSDLIHARNALVLALAELVAHRDLETGSHLLRLQRYSRCLAEEAAGTPGFAGQIDENFIQMLECCAPLHDIGKVGVPDHILLKPGKLEPDERIIMQTHTTMGADTLQKVAKQHGFPVAFLQMAADIARHHHERYDGKGYPDRLVGNDIPLAARIVTIADVYDALRSRRPYKPALSHATSVQVMLEASEGQFDPLLLQAFQRCASQFERLARDVTG